MDRSQRIVLIVSILASFVAFLDGSVVNVALPAISRELGGGLATQEWVVDSYLVTLGSFILLAGSLSDLFGRRRILTAGLVSFAVASLLCSIAPNSSILIIGRALQGVSGALLVPSSLALILSAFAGKPQGKAIGRWTAWTGIAFIVGPLLGGFLVDALSWRYIFAINIIPIAACLWLVRLIKPDRPSGAKLDVIGALLCSIGLSGTVFGLIEQPRYGWGSAIIGVALTGGILTLCTFVLYEKRVKNAMLPLSLFKIRNFSFGNLATLAIYGGLSISTFIIVIFLQQVGGYSALAAGLALLPITIIMFFLSSRFGTLAGTHGPRLFMTVGPITAGAGFILMLRVTSHIHYWSQLLPGVVVFALGLSMTVAPLTSAILVDVKQAQAGIASAVNNAVARIAGLVTIAIAGVIVGTHIDLAGFHPALIAPAILMVCGGVVSWAGIRNHEAS